jgi:hypothetical protein
MGSFDLGNLNETDANYMAPFTPTPTYASIICECLFKIPSTVYLQHHIYPGMSSVLPPKSNVVWNIASM